jgi:peptidoglycan/LPS O-acetylase OafA/YrhL
MLDVYRFLLALCVMQAHLLGVGSLWLSWQAVFSFYVLSGFLMTMVLNEAYGFTAEGLARFAANRFLRLYPTYYVVLLLTTLCILVLGPLNELNGSLQMPATLGERLANLAIIGLVGFDHSQINSVRLSPTAWSLSVEIFCYFLLAIYFAASPRRLIVMAIAGGALTLAQIVGALDRPDFGFMNHYRVLQSGLLPFAVGGLCYHWRHLQLFSFSWTKLAILAGLFIANGLLGHASAFHQYVAGLYVAIALNALIVPMLFTAGAAAPWQKLVGNLAYPLFISHWLVGTLLALYLPALPKLSLPYFIVASALSIAVALALYVVVDRPVQSLRARVRTFGVKARPAAEASARL